MRIAHDSLQTLGLRWLRLRHFADGGEGLRQDPHAAPVVVLSGVAHDEPENSISALGLQRELYLGSAQTAWHMLHRLRSAMVRADRTLLHGEVDEHGRQWRTRRAARS